MTTLSVLCGAPCSGKSTYAAMHFPRNQVISYDEVVPLTGARSRIDQHVALQVAVRASLGYGDVCCDFTSQDQHDRYAWLSIAGLYGARTHLIVLNCDRDTLHRRNAAREYPLPSDQIDACFSRQQRLSDAIRYEPWDAVTVLDTSEKAETSAA